MKTLTNRIKQFCNFLKESNGKDSLIRLQSFLTLLFAFAIIVYQIIVERVFLELDILLIVAAFVPKYLQKYAELAKPDYIKRIRLPTIKDQDKDGEYHNTDHNN